MTNINQYYNHYHYWAIFSCERGWYEDNWYIITKTLMMASLKKADQVNGYFMTDSSIWVTGKKDLKNLKVLFKGDPVLINTYHGLRRPVENGKTQEFALKFIDFFCVKTRSENHW